MQYNAISTALQKWKQTWKRISDKSNQTIMLKTSQSWLRNLRNNFILTLWGSVLCTALLLMGSCCIWRIWFTTLWSYFHWECYCRYLFWRSQLSLFFFFFFTLSCFCILLLKKGLHIQYIVWHTIKTQFSFTYSRAQPSENKKKSKKKKIKMAKELFRFNTNFLLRLSFPLAQDKDGQALPRCRLCHWR